MFQVAWECVGPPVDFTTDSVFLKRRSSSFEGRPFSGLHESKVTSIRPSISVIDYADANANRSSLQ